MSNRLPAPATLGAALALIAGVSVVARADVSGQFVVDGKPVKITHAYAYAEKGFFDPKKQDVVVVLCDAEVAPDVARDWMSRRELSKAGMLRCVEQIIDSDKKVINYKVQHEPPQKDFYEVPYSYDVTFSRSHRATEIGSR